MITILPSKNIKVSDDYFPPVRIPEVKLADRNHYRVEDKDGVYVCLYPSVSDTAFLRRRCKVLDGSPVTNFHVAIVYSPSLTRRNPSLYTQSKDVYKTVITDVKNLGEYTTVILELTPELEQLQKKWLDNGAVSTYPNFIPHLSLAKKQATLMQLDSLKDRLLDREITLSNETWIINRDHEVTQHG